MAGISLPGGLCDEHRAFRVTEELTGSLDRRQFHVTGPQTCPEKVKLLGAIPQVGERPCKTPQHGLEVFNVEVQTLTYRSWRVSVLYRPATKVKVDSERRGADCEGLAS